MDTIFIWQSCMIVLNHMCHDYDLTVVEVLQICAYLRNVDFLKIYRDLPSHIKVHESLQGITVTLPLTITFRIIQYVKVRKLKFELFSPNYPIDFFCTLRDFFINF